jgi:APA family basic amino acid/polyamine antiporter
MTFDNLDLAFYAVAGKAGGTWLMNLTIIATAFSWGIANALAAQAAISRVLFSMARDKMLPAALAKVHPKFKTPYFNNLLIGVAVAIVAALVPIGVVAQMANIGTLSAFIVVSIGVIILRKTRPDLKRPFRTPLMPYLPIAAVLASGYLVINLPRLTMIRFVVWVAIGIIVYFAYSKKHSVCIHIFE